MFRFVKTLLINQFGNLGAVKFVHLDYEDPAMNAFSTVFPGITVVGCLFHYTKALNTKVQQKGLQSIYQRSHAQCYDAPQFESVRKWIRRLAALPLIPVDYVLPIWTRVLQNPPFTGNSHVDNCLLVFREYFGNQWMNEHKIKLCNQFDNTGPRTINHAEGYNNRLKEFFRMNRPRLSVFLVKFQESHHHSSHVRSSQLENGAQPAPRLLQSVLNDTNIDTAKSNFLQSVNCIPPGVDHAQYIDSVILCHLDLVQNYLCDFSS